MDTEQPALHIASLVDGHRAASPSHRLSLTTKAWLMDTEQPALHIAFHSLSNFKNGKTIIHY